MAPPNVSVRGPGRLAAFYVERCKTGSRSPIEDIKNHFRIDKSVARNRLSKARQFGFLTKGQAGVAGQLTDHARKLLKGEQRVKKTR